MNYDVIVVGAGISGLSVGALLSAAGRSVLVLEKNRKIGGRFAVQEKQGFLLDYGIHFSRFAEQGSCARVLRRIGVEQEFTPPGKTFVFQDHRFSLFPHSVGDFLRTDLLSLRSKLHMAKILALIPLRSRMKYFSRSMGEWVRDTTDCRQVIDLLRIFCAGAFVTPDMNRVVTSEVLFFLSRVAGAKKPVGYPKGGWKPILNRMEEKIRRHGRIATGEKVTQIVVRNGRVEEVVTDKGGYTGPAVICTIPFQHLQGIVDLSLMPRRIREYANEVESTSGISLDIALSRKVSDRAGLIITTDPITYGCFVSNVEPCLAPAGMQILTWFRPMTREQMREKDGYRRGLSGIRKTIRELFPQIEGATLFERPLRLDIVDGVVLKPGQASRDRPSFQSGIRNLFFAGDGTGGRGQGGDIAFDSAIRCSEQVQGFLKGDENHV